MFDRITLRQAPRCLLWYLQLLRLSPLMPSAIWMSVYSPILIELGSWVQSKNESEEIYCTRKRSVVSAGSGNRKWLVDPVSARKNRFELSSTLKKKRLRNCFYSDQICSFWNNLGFFVIPTANNCFTNYAPRFGNVLSAQIAYRTDRTEAFLR